MKRMLIGFVLMFFGYASGVFEWHLIVILSNIIGVCIAYSGYLTVKPLRKLHLSYSLSMYGLSNLLLLALRFNNISITGLPLESAASIVLSIVSLILTFAVLFYPNMALAKIIKTFAKEYPMIHLSNERKLVEKIALILMSLIVMVFFLFPPAVTPLILVYVVLHFVILWMFADKMYHISKNPTEKIVK